MISMIRSLLALEGVGGVWRGEERGGGEGG